MEAIDLFMCQGMRDRVRVGTSRKEGAVIVLLKEKSGSGASAVAYFPPSISVVIFMHKKEIAWWRVSVQ